MRETIFKWRPITFLLLIAVLATLLGNVPPSVYISSYWIILTIRDLNNIFQPILFWIFIATAIFFPIYRRRSTPDSPTKAIDVILVLAVIPLLSCQGFTWLSFTQLYFGVKLLTETLLITTMIIYVYHFYVRSPKVRPAQAIDVGQTLAANEGQALAADLIQAFVAIPVVGYLSFIWFFTVIAPTAGPYHLDTLNHSNAQYNVLLAPNWDKDANYLLYECNSQGTNCVEHKIWVSMGPTQDFKDLAHYDAKLGVVDGGLYICILDANTLVLITNPQLDENSQRHKFDDPLCRAKWPNSSKTN